MFKKRFYSILLVLALLISSMGTFVPAVSVQAVAEDATVVIACSDFQNSSGNDAGVTQVNKLFSSIKNAGYTDVDGFLCSGDYDYEYNEGAQGLAALKGAVESNYGSGIDYAFCQGNHDNVTPGTSGFAPSGNNDTDDYGVYVINEDDYMWHNDNESRVKETAANLEKYLDGKRRGKYSKPIFIVSHLALNYSMRTYNDGDGKYAHYIFNVLNEAGANGLNIIFMFGHNHSNGWDDYLGSGSIYLEKGDNILISQGNQYSYETETLNFTYMNAGYIGYYTAVNSGVDSTLTMTVFEITDDKVVVSRFDENGLHNLKSAGVSNAYKNEVANGGYYPNTKVVQSPRELTLNKNIIKPEVEATAAPATAKPTTAPIEPGEYYVRVTSVDEIQNGDRILMISNNNENQGNEFMLPEGIEINNRIGFSVEKITGLSMDDMITGEFEAKEWTFTKSGNKWLVGKDGKNIKLTSTSNKSITATLEDTGDAFTIGGSANEFTFTAESNSNYVLNRNGSRALINGYGNNPAKFYLYRYVYVTDETKYVRVSSASNIKDGDQVLMICNGSEFMLPEGIEINNRIGFAVENVNGLSMDNTIYGDFEAKEWTFTKSGDKWLIGKDGKNIKLTSTNDKSITATLENTGDVFTLGGSANAYTFTAESNSNYVLNRNGSRALINGYGSNPAAFYLYRVSDGNETEEPDDNNDDEIYGDCDHPRTHIIDKVEPTETENGYSGDEVCSNCGKVMKEGIVLPALNGPTVEILGASIRNDADVEAEENGKQAIRFAIKVKKASLAEMCGIVLQVEGQEKVVVISTDNEHRTMYEVNKDEDYVIYAVKITGIDKSDESTRIKCYGIVREIDSDTATEVVGVRYDSASDSAYKSVEGIREAIAESTKYKVDFNNSDVCTLLPGLTTVNNDGSVTIKNESETHQDFITLTLPDEIVAKNYSKVTIEYKITSGSYSFKYYDKATNTEHWAWNSTYNFDSNSETKVLTFDADAIPVNKLVIFDLNSTGEMLIKSIKFSDPLSAPVATPVPTTAPTAAPTVAPTAVPTDVPNNLITNGDFSNGKTGWSTNYNDNDFTVSSDNYGVVAGRWNNYSGVKYVINKSFSIGDVIDYAFKVKLENDYAENGNVSFAVTINTDSTTTDNWVACKTAGGATVYGSSSEWTEVKGTYIVSADTDSLTFMIAEGPGYNADRKGTFYIDDLSAVLIYDAPAAPTATPAPTPTPVPTQAPTAVPTATPNPAEPVAKNLPEESIIVNGDFSNGTNGWSREGGAGSISIVSGSNNNNYASYTGRWNQWSTVNQNIAGNFKKTGIITVTSDIYSEDSSVQKAQIDLQYTDETGTVQTMEQSSAITSGQWCTVTGTFTLPMDASEVIIRIGTRGAAWDYAGNYCLDNVYAIYKAPIEIIGSISLDLTDSSLYTMDEGVSASYNASDKALDVNLPGNAPNAVNTATKGITFTIPEKYSGYTFEYVKLSVTSKGKTTRMNLIDKNGNMSSGYVETTSGQTMSVQLDKDKAGVDSIQGIKLFRDFSSAANDQVTAIEFFYSAKGSDEPLYTEVDLSNSSSYNVDNAMATLGLSYTNNALNASFPGICGLVIKAPTDDRYTKVEMTYTSSNSLNGYVFDSGFTDGIGQTAVGQHDSTKVTAASSENTVTFEYPSDCIKAIKLVALDGSANINIKSVKFFKYKEPEPTEAPVISDYNKRIMSINVTDNTSKKYTVNGSTCDVTMQYISASVTGDYFTGSTFGNDTGGEGSVVIKDYKDGYKNGEKQYCARYIVSGQDNTGASCKFFIEDNGVEMSDGTVITKPILITNSKSLEWMQTADIIGVVSDKSGGKVIDIMWNESNTTPVTPAPVVRPDNTKNYNRELFVFNVSVGGSWGVESSSASSSMIHFNVESNCTNFKGTGVDADWGFVDTRKQFSGQVQSLSARYILEGTDVNGNPCKIYVENNGIDDNGMVTEPIIITDSPEYAWIETAPLHGTVSWGEKLNIHMWTTSN